MARAKKETTRVLVLVFESERKLDSFVGGLLDGFGENAANYEWANGKTPWRPGMEIRVSDIEGDDEDDSVVVVRPAGERSE